MGVRGGYWGAGAGVVSLDTKLRKGLSEKVNYNLKIKGRGVSLEETGKRTFQKEVTCVTSLKLKKKSRNFKKANTTNLCSPRRRRYKVAVERQAVSRGPCKPHSSVFSPVLRKPTEEYHVEK